MVGISRWRRQAAATYQHSVSAKMRQNQLGTLFERGKRA
jgi:hypothetical protein